MALSQLQCLDDNHVNPRTHESKPEFFYCEDQRLALELLLRDGREAFVKYLEARGLRGFLSDPELETLVGAVEPYDPGSELFPGNAEDSEPPLSLHYWPDLSDTSVPNMDLGWPDSESYRGVTRTTVYAQPPLEGQAHVKEVVRKMIAQAQKVIAVVMDVFTDVDIFRDLLDAGFKRKVSVYILLERTTLPHFLSMCRRANMHAGHLKNLRVRCTEGAEFHTRSCTKVTGRMGHRFMFVDGDKAVSGSYSFTWMSSRLDRNIVTVITGQAVEAFDRLFRFLYVTSSSVALGQVATEPEPELEPLPQPAAVVLPSAALARKLHNPKYALVAAANPTPAAERNSPKEPSKNPESNKRRQKRASKEAVQDVPPLHPGLTDLEKACLIEYLPTWPEPDPASDVIGFINIRDAKKPTQVHLQRSEMFETSQAIRFSSPISIPKEILPVVAKPRQLSAEPKQMFKPQPTPDDTEAVESPPVQPSDIKCNKEEETEQETPASRKKTESAKDTAVLTTENNLQPSTLASHDAGHSALPHVAAHTPPESTNNQGPSYNTHITTNSAKPESRPGPHTEIAVGTSSNTQSVELRTEDLESNTTQSPHVQVPSSSNTEHHTKEITELPLTTSHRQAAHTQPQISEMTSNIQAPTLQSHITTTSPSEIHSQSDSPSSLSENSLIPVTTSITANVCGPSIVSPSPQTVQPSHLSSTASPSLLPPVPKPRTVQLVIKHGGTSDGNNLPEISVVRKTENLESAELDVANVAQLPPETEKETLTELHTSEAGPQKDTESAGKPEEAPQQQQRVTFQETKREEAVGPHDNKAETQAQSDVLITDAPKAGNGNTREIIPEEVDPERLPQTDFEITSKTQTEQTATIRIDADASEKAQTDCECVQVPNEKNNNEPQHSTHHPRAKEAQRITPCETNPQDKGLLENGNSHSPPSNSSISHRADDNKDCPQENADLTDDNANMIKQSMDPNTICQKSQQAPKARGGSHTPERPLCLRLSDTHVRDLRLPASDQEPQSPTSLSRRATPDGFLSCTSTPDSRTYTPGPRSFTPDFRTPPDGYVSPRDDSPLSTTSEEYYECSDSIPHDPGSESVAYCNHETTEDRVIFSNTTATTIPTTTISAACVLGTADSNELQRLPGPVSISSSSVLERKAKIGAKEKTVNEENGREEDEKERNVAERRTEQGSYGTETKSSEEAKKTADQLQTEMVEKDNVSQTQAPNRKKGLSISASESSADGEVTQGMDPKRLSSDALTPDDVSSEVEKANKETVADKARSSGVDKRDRAQTTRESDGQKILHSLRKLSQGKQQETGCSSSSQPPRPPRLISAIRPLGTRPWGSHQTNLAESKVPSGSSQALDNASSHRRPASRPPPPLALGAAGFTAEQKRARLSRSQQSLVSLDLSAQGRTRGGQSQNESSQIKPQSGQEAHRQEGARSPFTITFGRLYSLKGLKEKMSKPPAQSRRGSTSSPLQRHKSTS